MAFTYEAKRDKDYSIEREWGFPGKEDAGQAKLALGKNLLAIIAKEERVSSISLGDSSNSYLNAVSDRFFGYGYNFIHARLEGNKLCVAVGAKHKGIPIRVGGTFSEMYVSLNPQGKSSRPVMETDLVKRMVEYLDYYQFQPQLSGNIVPEPAR